VLLWKLAPHSRAAPSPGILAIVWDIRLPRTLLALLVGASLALAGGLLQVYFRNVLAGPFVVGVSSGAALGAVLAMVLGLQVHLGGMSSVPLLAFAGGLAAVLLVGFISSRWGRGRPETLLLTGIAVGAVFSAVTSLLMVTSQQDLQRVLFWLLGSFGSARWLHVGWMLPFFVLGILPVLLLGRHLDVLAWGDEVALSLGVSVGRVRALLLAGATLLASASVAVAGLIGFLGLMVPHVARLLVGPGHRRMLPLAALLGAGLLLAADMVARAAWAPTELPIGAITAILGAPFLAYLCNRRA
jgi:iron complex transport system permease protein